MSFSRRQFLIGTVASVAGAVLPSFANRVFSHVAKTGSPLLEAPVSERQLFYALHMDEYYLLTDASAGTTLTIPPPTSWREYYEFEKADPTDKYLEDRGLTSADLDNEADGYSVEDQWELCRSPSAQAFIKLSQFEDQLGPDITGEDCDDLQYVDFKEFSNPCSNARWVEVPCAVGLSFLQHRLNVLNTGIRIEMAPEDIYYA